MIQKLITITLLVIAAICLVLINIAHEGPLYFAGLILAILALLSASVLLVSRSRNQGSHFDTDLF